MKIYAGTKIKYTKLIPYYTDSLIQPFDKDRTSSSASHTLICVCLKLMLCAELFLKFLYFTFYFLRYDWQTSLPFLVKQTKHFIVLVLEMTMFATNETFSGVVHIYKLLILLPPPSHFCFQSPELSCSIAIICFLIVVGQH